MAVFMKVSGRMIRNMAMEYFNTLMAQNTMESGKMTFVMGLGRITILMGISMMGTGIKTSNKEWGLIITQMEIFTRENGSAENPMERATTFIRAERLSIKVIGKTEKRKVLVSW